MQFLLYYLLYALAWLPLPLLYLLSSVLWPVVYYVVRYRRKVTRANLLRSFPEKRPQEIRRIERGYYRHLMDLLVEAMYNLRATPRQILRHYHIVNRQVINRYYEQGQSVILMSAHYNNWEYMVSSLNMQLRHHGVGVGQPLNEKTFGYYLTRQRTRYGTEVVDHTNVRAVMAYYERYHVPTAYMMLSDQSPSNPNKCLWTDFLHQETGFIYGAEHFARKYHYPVLLYAVKKVRRGRYEITLSELTSNPDLLPEGDITRRYAAWLEQQIEQQPDYWLWSHRRWKRKKPMNP